MTDPWIERDASGRPTGIIEVEGAGWIRADSAKPRPKSRLERRQHGA